MYILVGEPESNNILRVREVFLRVVGMGFRLELLGLQYDPLAGYCVHCNKPSYFIK